MGGGQGDATITNSPVVTSYEGAVQSKYVIGRYNMIRCDVILCRNSGRVGTQIVSELRLCRNSGKVGTQVKSELRSSQKLSLIKSGFAEADISQLR